MSINSGHYNRGYAFVPLERKHDFVPVQSDLNLHYPQLLDGHVFDHILKVLSRPSSDLVTVCPRCQYREIEDNRALCRVCLDYKALHRRKYLANRRKTKTTSI
jgi:hypothetical protein